MIELSIVIPCYNEAGNIEAIWQKAITLLNAHTYAEIILVNNGSTDNTAQLLLQLQQQHNIDNMTICTVDKNIGYGYGITSGLAMAKGQTICWTHADQQTDIADTTLAYALYKADQNTNLLVKGKRRNRNWLDAFFTWGMQVYTNIKLGSALSDINAQPKLFSNTFWQKVKAEAPLDFSLDLFVLYKAKQSGEIKTIDVDFKKRIHGEAKGGGSLKGKWKLIKRTFAYINQLAKKL